ncbi:hypothetical protein HK101_011036 [Irineochytrium annulatum]|nr:hypothetical protein HK101_011036 [Irineochytrium annulatum]
MKFIIASSVVVALASRAAAWGDSLGHPTTGELAQTLLNDNARKIILPLLDPTFSSSLGGQSDVDMMAAPPSSCGFVPSDCAAGNCIIGAITTQTAVLLNAKCAASTEATEAVQFLAHFLGDISQPLHNCNRDLGGNNDKVTYNGKSTNFHAIHDTQILDTRSAEVSATSASAYASFLASTYGANSASYTTPSFIDIHTLTADGFLNAVINMANDGNALDCESSAFWALFDKNPSQDFSGAYYAATKVLLEEQVAKAGYRMAAWFNAIADECAGAVSTPTSPPSSSTTSTTSTSTKTTTTKTVPPTPPPTCAHSICTAGAALTSTCDPCARQIIAADPYCGSTSWDSVCVSEVASVCKSSQCTTKPVPPPCAHNICKTGAALDPACDPCVKKIVAKDPYCGATKWNYICVDEVESIEMRAMRSRDAVVAIAAVGALAVPLCLTDGAGAQSILDFSSLDGFGNNPQAQSQGAAGQPYLRMMPAYYADGVGEIVAGRPSPRQISNALFGYETSLDDLASTANQLLLNFGQLIAHDVGLTPDNSSDPYPIPVPRCDALLDNTCTGNASMPFQRSTRVDSPKGNVRAFPNSASSYIDGGIIYGDKTTSGLLREGVNGLLSTSPGNLPLLVDATSPLMLSGPRTRGQLFFGGDPRQNINPALSALTIVFFREHNRRALLLAAANPDWDDELIFQTARKMVIGILQHINFDYYVPSLIGSPLPTYQGYQPQVDATVDLFFFTCAFRYGHSGIPPLYFRYDQNGPVPEGPLLLRDNMFNAGNLIKYGIESLLRGLLFQHEQRIDTLITTELRSYFNMPSPFDLAAWNIQRGRDLGIQTYNQARQFFNLPQARKWSDVTTSLTSQLILNETYPSVAQLDAWVGGMAEPHAPGARVGPLFAASLKEQFTRLRDGDRFYYGNNASGLYTADEVKEIKATTMGSLIRQTCNIAFPDDAFSVPSSLSVLGNGTAGGASTPAAEEAALEKQEMKVKIADGLLLKWAVNGDYITFEYFSQYAGWYAIGFGSSQMAGSDVVVVSMSNNAIVATEYYSTGDGILNPTTSPVLLNVTDTTTSSASAQGYARSCKFTRRLVPPASSPNANAIVNGTTTFIYAWSTDTDAVGYHGGNKGSGAVNFLATSASGLGLTVAIGSGMDSSVKAIHGSLMLLTFGLIYPAGAMVARYLHTNGWLALHEKLMEVGTSDVVISAVTALVTSNGNLMVLHSKIGVAIFAVITASTVMGFLAKSTIGSSLHITRRVLQVVHPILGIGALLIGWYNCVLGLTDIALVIPAFATVRTAWYFWMVLVILLFIYMEFRHRRIDIHAKAIQAAAEKPFPEFTWRQIHERIEEGSKWVVVAGIIYDITELMRNHPGGAQVLMEALGTDGMFESNEIWIRPDRYITATHFFYKLEPQQLVSIKPLDFKRPSLTATHMHSKMALYQLQKYAVGALSDDKRTIAKAKSAKMSTAIMSTRNILGADLPLLKEDGDPRLALLHDSIQANFKRGPNSIHGDTPVDIKLTSKTLLTNPSVTSPTYMFTFTFTSPDQRIDCLPGDHCSIHLRNNDKMVIRSYTPVSCHNKGSIDLMVKIYSEGKFTGKLNKMAIGERLKLRGPVRGKNIINDGCLQMTGCYANVNMIAGGSGLAPMLQVLRYYMQYSPKDDQGSPYCIIRLLFVNSSDHDIIAKEMLDELQDESQGMLRVTYLVSRVKNPRTYQQCGGLEGRISAEILRSVFPSIAELPPACDGGYPGVGKTVLFNDDDDEDATPVDGELPHELRIRIENGATPQSPAMASLRQKRTMNIASGRQSVASSIPLRQLSASSESAIYLVCGPAAFNDNVKRLLAAAGSVGSV